jgi:hypothetical protein
MSQLTINQAGSSTFTHAYTIDSTDFSVQAAGTLADSATKSFDYIIPAGAIVQKVAFKLNEAFDDSGAGSQLTITIGDDDTAAGYIGAAQIHVDSTEVTYAYNDGSYFTVGGDANTVNGKLYTAAGKEFKLLFTPAGGGTAYSLNELTQGNITVFIEMAQL